MMLRAFAVFVVCAVLACAAVYIIAGRTPAPILAIDHPERVVGQRSMLEVTAIAPRTRLSNLTITFEQNGRTVPLFSLEAPQTASVSQPAVDRVHVSRPF